MKKVAVLIFTNSFRIGGSERQAVELAKRLDPSKFELIVACFQKDGPLSAELPCGLDKVHAFPLAGFFNWNAFRRAVDFIRLLRKMRVQVVQCFDFYSNVFAIPLARLAGVPVILGSRRDEGVTLRTRAQRMVEGWCYRLATGVVANAEAIKAQLVKRDGLRPERAWVIHNGLDLDRFDQQGSVSRADHNGDGVTVAVVANLRQEKGHMVFLDAAHRLAGLYPQARFRIVGDGPMWQRIEARVKELGLSERVEMTGATKDIPAFLQSIDIMVNPSHTEGFPNAVLEAMAASLPVVATDVGGTHELVGEGLTGYLVPPGDGAVMAERLARLCKDPDARLKMGEAGRRRMAERFTADLMAKRFETLYQTLVCGN
jgi:glycosyltransferase involved in cell wall biosynthesis